jgi:putative ABC transport system substrate-binding protein
MRLIGLAIVLAADLLIAPLAAEAQHVDTYRIGWLATGRHPFIASFREGMRELGYSEGENLVIEERYARAEQLPQATAELVSLRPDVLFTSGAVATTVARKATTSLPIVSVSADPVSSGSVASMAEPGGNVTGLAILSSELAAKSVELAKEAFPRISRVVVLLDPGTTDLQYVAAERSAHTLSVKLTPIEVRKREDIERGFQVAAWARAAVVPLSSPLFLSQRQQIVSIAARYKVPTVYEHRDFVEISGGMISYGPDLHDLFRRSASYVDRILKGAQPTDLPVGEPTKFELVINLKAAKSLGVTIPQALLLRADQVIE